MGPLDEQMKYLDGHEFVYGAILAGTPKWNKKDAPGSLPVNNLPGWSNYVTELAKHVKGRVRHFEVWNEPPNFTGKDQTPADYAKIVVASYDAVKAVDPTALVGLASKSAHVNYLEQVILAGAKDHFDYIVLHPYEVLDGVADDAGSESVFMHIVSTVRKMLAARNPARANVPVIFTELGPYPRTHDRAGIRERATPIPYRTNRENGSNIEHPIVVGRARSLTTAFPNCPPNSVSPKAFPYQGVKAQ